MIRALVLFICLFVMLSCAESKKETPSVIVTKTTSEVNQINDFKLEIYDFEGLKPFLNKQDNKVHVVNFWATWCAPCLKEMPHFEKLNANYKDKNVEVLFVSLDFPFNYEKKLKPYIKEHKLQSKVVALDDPDMNAWMPKVNENWTGAIPITIIYNKEKRQFYERTFTYSELEKEVKQFIN